LATYETVACVKLNKPENFGLTMAIFETFDDGESFGHCATAKP
jgi:hypothetical protein